METKSDIIAELRSVAFSMKVHDATMPEVYDILCGVAFRLEAAWKREKADAESDALAVGGIVEAARTTEKSSAVGNAAAIREALREVQERFVAGVYSGTIDCNEALRVVEAALAMPARNCDVLPWRTAWDEWRTKHHPQKPQTYKESYESSVAFLEWFTTSATEEGGAK